MNRYRLSGAGIKPLISQIPANTDDNLPDNAPIWTSDGIK